MNDVNALKLNKKTQYLQEYITTFLCDQGNKALLNSFCPPVVFFGAITYNMYIAIHVTRTLFCLFSR